MDNKLIEDLDDRVLVHGVLPEKSFKQFMVDFHQDGVTIYDEKDNGATEEFGSLTWSDFSTVTIKHFKKKTTVTFYAEDRFRVLTVNNEDGERLEQFLRSNPSVDMHVVGLKFYNAIPGFRSETRWKMITSAIVYMWLLGLVYKLIIN